jgi:Protein of unknown function (DUF4229)
VVALMKYTVLRAALFVGVLVLLSLLGAGRLIAIVGAAVVSMLLSYIFLRRPREAVTSVIADRVEKRTTARGPSAAELDAATEDAVDDAHRTAPPAAS